MKRIFLSAVLAAALATSTVANGARDVRMAAFTVERDAVVSSQSRQESSETGMWVMFAMLLLVAAAAFSSGGGSDYGPHYYGVSDAKLKTDLRRVGTSPAGFGIYQFRYRGHDQMFEGALAQDVAQRAPQAVGQTRDGYLMVDYRLIDVVPRLIR
jgi:hypothetical protein